MAEAIDLNRLAPGRSDKMVLKVTGRVGSVQI